MVPEEAERSAGAISPARLSPVAEPVAQLAGMAPHSYDRRAPGQGVSGGARNGHKDGCVAARQRQVNGMSRLVSPKELRLNVGDACNRRCPACSKNGAKDSAGESASLDDLLRILDETRGQGTLEAVSVTGGEPLHPALKGNTFRLIEHARPARVRLCTNGDFLDATVAEGLRNLGLESVQIGLDSSTAAFQNRRSGSPDAWRTTMRGVALALHAGLSVSIRYTLYAGNRHDVAATYRMVAALGVDRFKLRTLFPSGAAIQGCGDLLPTAAQLAQAQFDALRVSRGATTQLELSQPVFFIIPEGCNAFLEDNHSCGEWSNASINSRGIVEYCLFCDDGSRFGNIRNRPFLELWNSPEIALARERRKRNGVIVGCPAYEVQRQRYLGDYERFERELRETTADLQRHL
jgi:PqqA peptide cyclase